MNNLKNLLSYDYTMRHIGYDICKCMLFYHVNTLWCTYSSIFGGGSTGTVLVAIDKFAPKYIYIYIQHTEEKIAKRFSNPRKESIPCDGDGKRYIYIYTRYIDINIYSIKVCFKCFVT